MQKAALPIHIHGMRQLLIFDRQPAEPLVHFSVAVLVVAAAKTSCAGFIISLLNEHAIVEVPPISSQGNSHHELSLRQLLEVGVTAVDKRFCPSVTMLSLGLLRLDRDLHIGHLGVSGGDWRCMVTAVQCSTPCCILASLAILISSAALSKHATGRWSFALLGMLATV
jgi:hypothetical protein